MTDRWLMAGSAEMLILKLLSERDMYGYMITDELKKRSKDVFSMKAGTLYPLLHALEEKGVVASYESMHDGRLRKYYKITGNGKSLLAEKEDAWKKFCSAVDNIMAEVSHA